MWPRIIPAAPPPSPWYEQVWDQYQGWISHLDPNALVVALFLLVALLLFTMSMTSR